MRQDEQARVNGFFTEIETPTPLEVVSSPVTFDDFDEPRRMPTAPEVGQHTEEILLELDHSWEDIIGAKGGRCRQLTRPWSRQFRCPTNRRSAFWA